MIPDVIFDAWWNGQHNTRDAVLGAREWVPHRRLHQFRGNARQPYGRVTLEIDWDFLDVSLARPASSP